MNPGEHPLEEETTKVGYLITCSRLPTPSQWKPKEMSRPTCEPQMQGHLRVHSRYDTVIRECVGGVAAHPFREREPTKGPESSNEQTTRDDERETIGPDEIHHVWRLS